LDSSRSRSCVEEYFTSQGGLLVSGQRIPVPGGLSSGKIEKLPAPLNSLASFLRELALGRLSPIPGGLPTELHEMLSKLIEAVKEARQ
jgi:hypothetical protein